MNNIVEIFEQLVERQPEAIALIFGDKEITYGQLNRMSNRLAHILRDNYTLQKETIVSILLDKSEWMIVSLLGVLKAGGAYLPIDSSYPKGRIAYMLSNSKSNLILCDTQNLASVQEYANDLAIEYFCVEEGEESREDNPKREISSGDLAYLIYTSGTTGEPKGVMVEHGGFVNMILYQIESFGIVPSDNVIQFASFSFDASVYETFLALLSGATFVIVSKEALLNNFVEMTQKYKVTVAVLNPSFLANIEHLTGFKTIITAGEKAIVSDALMYAKECNYINAYGPTEASICSTFYKVNPHKHYDSIPIGKDIINSKIYILDDKLEALPEGSIGEIYISGKGLARGYLYQPELTEEKFIHHPQFGRVYRSGDLGRFLEEGNIEYLGRVDDQIKIRGHRVELGEIENTILEYPSIKEAVVLYIDKSLVAYIRGETLALKASLRDKLPLYMIPSYFVELKSFPLTPNGKIDKKALEALTYQSSSSEVLVANQTQKKLIEIVKEVMRKDAMGIDDVLFEYGLESLMAMSIVAKIKKIFAIKITISEIYQSSTIEVLASLIESKSQIRYSPIVPIEKQENYPLSNNQKSLWIIDKMQENLIAYNLPLFIKLENIQRDVLHQALYALIAKHEILRTNFVTIEGEVRQVISDDVSVESVETITVENPKEWMQKEAKRVFDLENDRLFYAKILNDEWLFITMHHIISDGWSMDILLGDLSDIYESLLAGKAIEPLLIQYKDYTFWQNNLLKDEAFIAENSAYWHTLLKEYKRLNLPTDYPRGAVQSFNGAEISLKLNKKLSSKLKRLSEDYTLFALLLAITQIVLSKYSNQEDIVVGIPVANRVDEALFEQIGFYVNTLPLRLQLNLTHSLEENLRVIQEVMMEALNYQSYPFDRVANEIEKEKDLSQNPLFNTMVVLQNSTQRRGRFGAYKEIKIDKAKFDLTFEYVEKEDKIELSIEYNSDLYKSTTIERLSKNIKKLIEEIELETLLSQSDIISKEEKKLLHSFNKTKHDYPHEETIVSLFEKQVKLSPESIAIVFESETITYAQLNKKVNQLAHYLIENGIEADDIVVIEIDRSIEMMIGILGILKAGGAYLPIDTEYPRERIEYIIQDSKAKMVLTYQEIRDEKLEAYKTKNPKNRVTPKNLAYVLYTSGSTGRPKGVMLEHEGVVNRIDWMRRVYHLESGDIILQKTPYSFDVSVWELFLPVMYGIKQVIAKPNGHKDNKYLVELINKESVTFLHFVPSMLNAMIYTNGLAHCPSIKNIVCSGEALSAQTVREFYATTDHIALHNLYGPTEASIDVTSFSCPRDRVLNTIPIGKSISNIKIYILDTFLNEVPLGVVGELHIHGIGLARGYLNQKALTDEKFISHPKFGRVYKSGDLAKYLENGEIEYLGRIDDQIKLRGFRIELGEIESCIVEYPSITQCVVMVRDDQLVAYIVGEEGKLKEHLQRKLTPYMVPNIFIQMESFPLNSNGKLDKKKLPLPQEITVEREIVLACSENEKMLLAIFEDVLNIKNISINDNFFFIGGDSIKAIQIISKLGSLGFLLEIKDIFYHPTISALSQILNHNSVEILDQSKVVGEFPLIPIQKFFIENFHGIHHFNQYILLESKREIEFSKLEKAFAEVIDHHDVLRSRFELREGEYRQIIDESSYFELEHIFSYENIGDIIKEANSSFHIEKTPLIKAILFGNTQLFITIHHLIIDGVSLRVLIEGLERAYQNIPLSQKTVSFKQWSNAIYDYANSDKIDRGYWREIEPYKIFDTKIGAKVANKEQLKFTFDKSLINKDYKLSSILLLAFAKVLYRRTQKERFSILMEGHGREDVLGLNTSRTIGWFTTLFIANIEYIKAHITTQLESIENAIELLHNGFDYGVLKYISKENLKLEPEVSFNYLGEIHTEQDSLFEIKDLALSSSYKNDRVAPIEVESLILDDLIVFIAFDNSLSELFADFDKEFKEELTTIMCTLNSNKTYNLTYAQKGLFLMNTLKSDLSVYNETVSCGFNSHLNIDALQEAFVSLIERHDILRTSFVLVDGIPKQRVVDKVNFEIERAEEADREKATKAFDGRLFDLSHPPLFRAKLMEVESQGYILLITFHHIIIDGWSLNVILDDLKAFYNAFVQKREVSLKPLSIQYKDFVLFSHNRLKKSEKERVFWTNKLRDNRLTPYIPYDWERQNRYSGGLVRLDLGADISSRLRNIAKESQKSLFALLLSLVDTLFYLYSNEEKITIGTPVANARDDEMFQNQIGLYLNTIVISSIIKAEWRFSDVLERVGEDILEAFNHQSYPFDKIVEDLNSTTPLFDVMVILQNFEKKTFDFYEAGFEIRESVNYGSKFDLKFEFEERENIELMIEYSLDIYKEETIMVMSRHLMKLFEVVSGDISMPLSLLKKVLNMTVEVEIDQDIDEDF